VGVSERHWWRLAKTRFIVALPAVDSEKTILRVSHAHLAKCGSKSQFHEVKTFKSGEAAAVVQVPESGLGEPVTLEQSL
jgi:hypothetical protein